MTELSLIKRRVTELLRSVPPSVTVVAAAKSRTPEEIAAAVAAGINVIGENYIQEAETAQQALGYAVQWHFIGHLQKNKAKKAAALFDMVETIDSLGTALFLDHACAALGKIMPVLVEINSAREPQKSGILPSDAEALTTALGALPHLKLMGLMTMGPAGADPQALRRAFRETRTLYDRLGRRNLPGVTMRYLSMGMSDSYEIALEEGANMIRLGSHIFGPRN